MNFRCLQRILSDEKEDSIPIIVFDPVLNRQEKEIIKLLGYQLPTETEVRIHYITTENTKVLFYLPHCPKTLANDILHTNWCRNTLASTYILGNSFDSVVNNLPSRIVR